VTGFQIAFETACVIILVLFAFALWLMHVAREAQQERDEAKKAAQSAQQALEQRQMAQAQISAAPTDAALDQSLANGTF